MAKQICLHFLKYFPTLPYGLILTNLYMQIFFKRKPVKYLHVGDKIDVDDDYRWRWWRPFSLHKDPGRPVFTVWPVIRQPPPFSPLSQLSLFCHICATILFTSVNISLLLYRSNSGESVLLMSLQTFWQPLKSLTTSSKKSQLCFEQLDQRSKASGIKKYKKENPHTKACFSESVLPPTIYWWFHLLSKINFSDFLVSLN